MARKLNQLGRKGQKEMTLGSVNLTHGHRKGSVMAEMTESHHLLNWCLIIETDGNAKTI